MSNLKQIRGQLRQIAVELLPQLTTQQQYEELKKHIDLRINKIEEQVKKTMNEINENHKNTMGYLVRQATQASVVPSKKEGE